jgi:serine/threonine-protein kinase
MAIRGDRDGDGTHSAAPTPLVLGGRYRLDAVIGRGGMGQVWRGCDEQLGRPVAVKVLRDVVPDQETAVKFTLEARTAAQLNGPQVVGVYDFGTDGDRFYLVMELVDGPSCAQELQAGGAMPVRRAAALGAQVARGLAVAHSHWVVHRDIKPANLLIDSQDRVRIADFGIARFTQDTMTAPTATGDGQIMGTAAYLAPERALGHPAAPASDVYALGCVLYQFLTGAPPFQGDVLAATLYQHVHAEPVPPRQLCPRIPVSLSDYVLCLLAKDPDQRPTAAQAGTWLDRWDQDLVQRSRAFQGRSLLVPMDAPGRVARSATPPPAHATASRPGRKPMLLAGAAASVVLVAGAIGILGMSGAPTQAGPHPTTTHTDKGAANRTAHAAPTRTRAPSTTGPRLTPESAGSSSSLPGTPTAVGPGAPGTTAVPTPRTPPAPTTPPSASPAPVVAEPSAPTTTAGAPSDPGSTATGAPSSDGPGTIGRR